jgi:uncharacterized membrane protein
MLSLTTSTTKAAASSGPDVAMTLGSYLAQILAVQLHLPAAVLAFLIGTYLMLRRKGTAWHKALGRIWIALMALVAISSFWITGLAGPGNFSPIHALSAFTLVLLAVALWAVRTGRVRTHRFSMIGIYAGGLIGAGAGALAPGRLISHILGYG